MKKRIANKKNKQLDRFAATCERIANVVVDKVSMALHLQRDIDEYQRYLGDLLVMLAKREPQCVLEHKVPGDDYMPYIWDKIKELINENKEMAQKLKSYEEMK